MKKIFPLVIAIALFKVSLGQQPKPVKEVSPEVKELQSQRDTAKAIFKSKVAVNSKDVKHYDKIRNNNAVLKEKLAAAKKAKNIEKQDDIQEKINLNTDPLKELNLKIKEDEKEIAKLEKEMEKAEKALKEQKEKEVKEKSKGKK
jgi:hypothetical protein